MDPFSNEHSISDMILYSGEILSDMLPPILPPLDLAQIHTTMPSSPSPSPPLQTPYSIHNLPKCMDSEKLERIQAESFTKAKPGRGNLAHRSAEETRERNMISARLSRARRREHLQRLEDENARLQREIRRLAYIEQEALRVMDPDTRERVLNHIKPFLQTKTHMDA